MRVTVESQHDLCLGILSAKQAFAIFNYYLVPSRSVKYCNHHFCMSVCFSVCLHIWKPHVQILPNFLCMLPVAWSSSNSSTIRYVLLVLWMSSCFQKMEGIGPNQRWCIYFVQFSRWWHRERSLLFVSTSFCYFFYIISCKDLYDYVYMYAGQWCTCDLWRPAEDKFICSYKCSPAGYEGGAGLQEGMFRYCIDVINKLPGLRVSKSLCFFLAVRFVPSFKNSLFGRKYA